MNFPKHILNGACLASTKTAHRAFGRNIARARFIQLQILKKILAANRTSDFGRQFRFDKIKGVGAFRRAVPVMSYEDYRPWIDRIADGEQGLLTRDRVRLLQPTGGSSGGSKWIPYTDRLLREFQSVVLPWWHDLYRKYPEMRRGRAYWSITPAGQAARRPGPVPVGYEQDADYFGWRGALIGGTFAVPPAVAGVRYLENFKYLTAYFLLKCADLSLISVWNPTFLILLLRDIEYYFDQIVADISDGDITLPAGEDIHALGPCFHPDPQRAKELRSVRLTDGPQDYSCIWPRLRLISCWTDAAADDYARQLHEMFPSVAMQGKGLLATEAIITVPWTAAGGNVPAYNGHFLEFIGIADRQPYLIHELKMGETYQVVVTTGGGLYRYDMGDRVRVTGHALGLPLLTFVGRDQVVDLVGEKLEEQHVRRAVSGILSRMNIDTRFVMLAPQRTGTGGYYILYIETDDPEQDSLLRQARVLIDTALKDNMQYAYARNIGQLSAPKVFHIRADGDRSYYRRCLEEGQRMGDIKPAVLDRRADWIPYFQGRLLETETAAEAGAPLPHKGAAG